MSKPECNAPKHKQPSADGSNPYRCVKLLLAEKQTRNCWILSFLTSRPADRSEWASKHRSPQPPRATKSDPTRYFWQFCSGDRIYDLGSAFLICSRPTAPTRRTMMLSSISSREPSARSGATPNICSIKFTGIPPRAEASRCLVNTVLPACRSLWRPQYARRCKGRSGSDKRSGLAANGRR